MALTEFQSGVLRLLAPSRLERESFVAGGVALNTQLDAARRSRDIDLFHDTIEALSVTLAEDRVLLSGSGYEVKVIREAPTFAEAVISRDSETTLVQWVHDSAFRFFPLQTNEELGLTLHPFDLATNKVLAMAGRLEVRDFVDLLTCCERLQPLGYLVWAACGKDPGYGPTYLLQEIRRGSRYSQAEVDLLDFDGVTPDAGELGRSWHEMLKMADAVCECLPVDEVGTSVITAGGDLCLLEPEALAQAVDQNRVYFHTGRIGGAWPTFPKDR